MAVRRLHPEQPAAFAFSDENRAWSEAQIAKFPPGKQASAIIPLMWRAQEQCGGWLPEPAIRAICDRLDMAYIRGLEVATFYTMFQLSPVGSVAHLQVCGTTPCMLRGARELVGVCETLIAKDQHVLSADGRFSWEEVECIGVCANAPVVQVGKDTYEDLTPAQLEAMIDGFAAGQPLAPGSQTGRTASCPVGGQTTLTDPSLFDGSTIGAWRSRFDEQAAAVTQGATETAPPSALASPAHKQAVAAGTSPSSASPPPSGPPLSGPQPSPPAATPEPVQVPAGPPPMNTAAMAAIANAGLSKDLEQRGTGAALSVSEIDRLKTVARSPPVSEGAESVAAHQPDLLATPVGEADDLKLIWGVGEKLAERMNALGIWHFWQIAKWSPEEAAWFETKMPGFKGRIARDKWVEQCTKLASGWRPGSDVGERPKD